MAPQQVRQRYIAEDRPVRVVVEVPAVGVPIVGLDDQKPSARLQHPRYFAYYPGRRIRLEVLEHIRRKHDIEGGGGQRGKLAPDIQNPRLYSWSGMPADVRPDVGGDAARRSDRIDPVTMTGADFEHTRIGGNPARKVVGYHPPHARARRMFRQMHVVVGRGASHSLHHTAGRFLAISIAPNRDVSLGP